MNKYILLSSLLLIIGQLAYSETEPVAICTYISPYLDASDAETGYEVNFFATDKVDILKAVKSEITNLGDGESQVLKTWSAKIIRQQNAVTFSPLEPGDASYKMEISKKTIVRDSDGTTFEGPAYKQKLDKNIGQLGTSKLAYDCSGDLLKVAN
jgi:hypothetical protein